MSWRIAESVVRGEIDNRLPGIIKGTLYLDGLKEPVALELEGNCDPDLAGRHLVFRNLMPPASKSLEGFSRIQCGEAGAMTANRMARIPTVSEEEVNRCIQERKPIPTRWSESLYLEWFSANRRVLIEGASFACRLSPARWKLSAEVHQWVWHLKERGAGRFLSEEDDEESCDLKRGDNSIDEPGEIQHPSGRTATDGCKTHPIVKRVSEFLLQLICESHSRRFYADEALENQPLEGMIAATTQATIRLAHVMARVTGPVAQFEPREIVDGLKRARWSLAEASEHAGLARHMGSADSDWLQELRREFGELRSVIRGLVHEYEDDSQESAPAIGASGTDSAQGE